MKTKILFYMVLMTILSSCSIYIAKQIQKDKYKDIVKNQNEDNLSETWPPTLSGKIDSNSMHFKIQKKFEHFSKSTCNCIDPAKLNVRSNYDYIPKSFRKLFKDDYFDIEVESAKEISNIGLFFYPFSKDERSTVFDSIIFEPRNIIAVEGFNYEIPYKTDGRFDDFFYSNTCSQYLYGSLDGKLEIPVALLEAGLQAEMQEQSTLIGIGGYFTSPLEKILTSNSINKCMTYFYLWDFYSVDKIRETEDYYFLNSLKAVSFKTAYTSEQMELFKVKGSLNVSASIAEISAELEAEINQESFFKGKTWETYIDKEYFQHERLDRFTPLPKPSAIKKFIEEYALEHKKSEVSTPFYQNTEHTHSVIFKGLPTIYKNPGEWTFISLDSIMYSNRVEIEVDEEHLPKVECKFVITGKPNDKLFAVDENDYKLFSYVLRSVKKVEGQSIDLKVTDIEFEINKQPNLQNIVVSQELPAFYLYKVENKYTYVWKFQQIIADDKNIFSGIPNQKIDKITLKNTNDNVLFDNITGTVEYNSSRKQLNYELTTSFETTQEQQSNNDFVKSTVELTIFIGSPRKKVKRTFEVTLPINKFKPKEVPETEEVEIIEE